MILWGALSNANLKAVPSLDKGGGLGVCVQIQRPWTKNMIEIK